MIGSPLEPASVTPFVEVERGDCFTSLDIRANTGGLTTSEAMRLRILTSTKRMHGRVVSGILPVVPSFVLITGIERLLMQQLVAEHIETGEESVGGDDTVCPFSIPETIEQETLQAIFVQPATVRTIIFPT